MTEEDVTGDCESDCTIHLTCRLRSIEELNEYELFVTKALRALQLQNNELTKLIQAHEERIQVLERQDMWSLMQGDIEAPPFDERVVRLADGEDI